MADIGIDVRGVPEVQRALSQLSGSPEAKRALQKASTAGAKTLKPFVQAEAPRGATGRLRKSVSSRQARKERPAAIVSARPKVAFYRHMVIRGTRPHMIRFPSQRAAGVPRSQGNIAHPGSRGNAFVARGFEAGRSAAESKIEQTMAEHVQAVARANGGG